MCISIIRHPCSVFGGSNPLLSAYESWSLEILRSADQYVGQPHIVAQLGRRANSVAQAWVHADPTHGQYVDDWAKKHVTEVQQWIKDNPSTPQPKAPDLAVVFFEMFSKENPGRFPSAVTRQAGGKTITTIEPVKDGTDIQSTFFDMWRQEHPTADLQDVPVTW